MRRKIVLVFLLFFVFAVFPSPALSSPQLPPTAEGPGFVLPDSPLFFLDELKQGIRLFLAIRPQDKAEVYNSIAGERLAELRFMLKQQNQKGIEIALSGFAENTKASAENLADAQFRGQNVEKLAEIINTDIKRRQEGIDVLLSQASGELKTMVLGTQTSVYESKAKVVNGIAPSRIENEIKNDQNRQSETKILGGAECSRGILEKLGHLKQRIDQASSIVPNKELRGTPPVKETRPVIDEQRRELLTAAYEKLIKAAKQCVEANTAFQTAYKEFNQLLNNSRAPAQIPTSTPQK